MLKPNQKRIDRGMWWDRAWSLVEGCTPVSPACKNCWSASATAMRSRQKSINIRIRYVGLTRHPVNERPSFNGLIQTMPGDLNKPPSVKKPTVWSVWNDLFHKDVPFEFQYKAFEMMLNCPQHFFIVCTKRPEIMAEVMPTIWFHLKRNYSILNPNIFVPYESLKNVMGMTTVENQEQADKRIPHLLKAEFAYRGLSVEPMLGPVKINLKQYCENCLAPTDWCGCGKIKYPPAINWVIAGPETGPGARECKPEWIKDLYEQCKAAGVAFFDKTKSDVRPWKGWVAREFPK